MAAALACVWIQQVSGRHRQRVLPDGCVDLIWKADRDLVVAGPATVPVHAELPEGTTTVGVRWRPGTGGPGLGLPLDALRDAMVPVDELWGRDAAEALSERLAEAPTAAARLALLQDVVAARQGAAPRPGRAARGLVGLAGAPCSDPRRVPTGRAGLAAAPSAGPPVALGRGAGGLADALVAAACRAVAADAAAGRVTAVGPLADALAVSERQLLRRFRAAVGYGPRTLARVLRFQRFLAIAWAPDRARDEGPRDLARLAAELGFADQAHLTRECRRLAGTTPARLLAGG